MRSKHSVSKPQIDRNYTADEIPMQRFPMIIENKEVQEIEPITPRKIIIYEAIVNNGRRSAAVAADTAKFIGTSVGFLIAHAVIFVGTVGYFIIILILEIVIGIIRSFRTADRERAVTKQIKYKQRKRRERTGNNIHIEGDLNAPNSTFNFYN